MTLSQLRCGPISVGARREPAAAMKQSTPISYDQAGRPDVNFWWWSPDANTVPVQHPSSMVVPKIDIHLTAGGRNGDGLFQLDQANGVWEILVQGPLVSVGRTWQRLVNKNGLALCGAQITFTARADGLQFVTLRLVNGLVRKDGTGFLGPFRFHRLDIEVQIGEGSHVMIVRDPRLGEVFDTFDEYHSYSIVEEGSPHYFPRRAILTREFALADDAVLIQRAIGDWHGTYLDIPTDYRSFGPSKSRIPKRGSPSTLWELDHGNLTLAEHTGGTHAPGAESMVYLGAASGPWHPAGHYAPYTHGGQGINLGLGWELNPFAATLHARMHRHTMERMPVACVDYDTGQPMRESAWDTPYQYDHSGGTGDTAELPPFRVALWNPDAPAAPYEALFDPANDGAWHKIDAAHGIRAIEHAINAWWMAGDFVAREDLRQIAEDLRMGEWSSRGVQPFDGPPGTWIPKSTRSKLVEAKKFPHLGGWYGRELGWVLTTCAADLATRGEGDTESREGARVHLRDLLMLVILVAQPTGFPQRAYWTPASDMQMPPSETGIQSFEWGILVHGLACALFSGLTFRSRLFFEVARLAQKGCQQLYEVMPTKPEGGGAIGPPHFVTTAVNGVPLQILDPSKGYKDGDPSHVYHAIAMAYRLGNSLDVLLLAEKQWISGYDMGKVDAFVHAMTDVQVRHWTSELESVLDAVREIAPYTAGLSAILRQHGLQV